MIGAMGQGTSDATTDETAQYQIGLPLEEQWRMELAEQKGTTGRAVSLEDIYDGTLYLSVDNTEYNEATTLAIDLETTETLWERSHEYSLTGPYLAGDTAVLQQGPNLIGLYPSTGEQRWTRTRTKDISFLWRSWGSAVPVSSFNLTDVGTSGDSRYNISNGSVTVYSEEGAQKWEKTGEYLSQFFPFDSVVCHLDSDRMWENDQWTIYTSDVVGREKTTGSELWRRSDIDVRRLRYDHDTGRLLAMTNTNVLHALDSKTGKSLWNRSVGGTTDDLTSGPDRVYYSIDSVVHALNKESMQIEWKAKSPSPIYDLTHDRGLLYVGTRDGQFFGLDVTTAKTVWDYEFVEGDGFLWTTNGGVITAAGNWVAVHQGQRGAAMEAIQGADSGGLFGSVSDRLADLFGRGEKVEAARASFEEGDYSSAVTEANNAGLTRGVVEAGLGVGVASASYTGGRFSVRNYRVQRLEARLEKLRQAYPIEDGPLAGEEPRALIQQVPVAIESLQRDWTGAPIRSLLRTEPEYRDIEAQIESALEIAPKLAEVSKRLEDFDRPATASAWAGTLGHQLQNSELDTLQRSLSECRSALKTAAVFDRKMGALPERASGRFDLDYLDTIVQRVIEPESEAGNDERTFCHAALDATAALFEYESKLNGYDLNALRSVISEKLSPTESERHTSGRLELIPEILTHAAEVEDILAKTDLSYTEDTHRVFKARIQDGISTLSLEQLNSVANQLNHINKRTWSHDDLLSFTPTEFEHLIALLYSERGYQVSIAQQKPGRAIDILGRRGDQAIGIEVKRYSRGNKVGRPDVEESVNEGTSVGAKRIVIVTSSTFTSTAREAAEQAHQPVDLVDGNTLLTYLYELDITVSIARTKVRNSKSRHRKRSSQHNRRQQSNSRQRSSNRNQTHNQSRQRQSRSRTASGQYTSSEECEVCGDTINGSLKSVPGPNGQTVQCCPACRERLENTAEVKSERRRQAYLILGVEPGADQERVKRAYREKVQEHHPDRGGDEATFIRVKKAYERITSD
ncbi:restriction endonuclease [Halomarina litorea]|uniref:restriction endonuclease n=1 Tax=Halomarina litorea TaxID=2961595 RepID=UPI0020C23214|nr:restriction endonuclease [Halomarina sp. BCD28]